MNLLAKFEELVDQSLITDAGVRFTADKLKDFIKISGEENQEFNFEVIRLLAEFLSAAVRFFRCSRINDLSISPIKQVSEGNTSMALPSKSPPQETPAAVKVQTEKPDEIIDRKNFQTSKSKSQERSLSNNTKFQKEKLLAERKKEIDSYAERKRGFAKKNKLERIMNLKVKKPSVPSVLKDYLNKSSESQDSFSRKKRNEQSFNGGSTSSFHDEIKKAEKEIRELEAAKTRIVLLYEKQVCFGLAIILKEYGVEEEGR